MIPPSELAQMAPVLFWHGNWLLSYLRVMRRALSEVYTLQLLWLHIYLSHLFSQMPKLEIRGIPSQYLFWSDYFILAHFCVTKTATL